MAIQNKLCIL